MSRFPALERLVSLAGSVASILAFGGALLGGAVVGAMASFRSLPQPWISLAAIGGFFIVFGVLSAATQWWRAIHPSSSLSRWLFSSVMPQAQNTDRREGRAASEQRSISGSLADLTQTQRKVLDAVEEATAGLNWVIQQKLQTILNMPGSELFYRLEQLRLLGFVDRERFDSNPPVYAYRLSAVYGQLRGRVAVAAQVSPTEE